MAGNMMKITLRSVSGAHPQDIRYTVWDSELSGFGLRISPTGNKSYLYKGYYCGDQIMVTIGKHGSPWTPDSARKKAKLLAVQISEGINPNLKKHTERKAIKVNELIDWYLKEGTAAKSPSTLVSDKSRINSYIKPLLGNRKVKDLKRGDIQSFLNKVQAGKVSTSTQENKYMKGRKYGGAGTAARTKRLLGGIFSFAMSHGIIEVNPAHGIKTTPDKRMQRFLNDVELVKLGEALAQCESDGANKNAISAIRLLALTGARKSEIVNAKWEEVDFDNNSLCLSQSKTGQKIIILTPQAMDIFTTLKLKASGEYIFPGRDDDKPTQAVPKVWLKVRKKAGLDDVRLHDLRHTVASIAVSSGLALPIVGAMLGHKTPSTTARYAHLADDPVRRGQEQVANEIANHILSVKSDN